MINSITTIQEITMQASVTGVYEYLFDTCNECRDIILNRFEEWGKEFGEIEKGALKTSDTSCSASLPQVPSCPCLAP